METTLSAYVDDFIATKKTEGRSVKTLSWYQWLLGKFCAYANDPALANFTLPMVRGFVAALQDRDTRYENHPISHQVEGGLSPHTISAYVRTLKVFSAWLAEEGYTKTDVLTKLKRPKLPETVIEVLTDKEINRIVDDINPNTHMGSRSLAIVLLLYDTGIRANELCTLTLENLDLLQNEFKVRGKGNKERVIPLGNGVKRAITRYVTAYRPESNAREVFLSDEGTALTYNGLKLLIDRLGKKAEIPRLHLHLFRHSFAVKYLMSGGDLISLQRILGHTSVNTTQLYLKLANRDIHTQHAKYSPVDCLGLGVAKRKTKS